jgi:hypothetical protein
MGEDADAGGHVPETQGTWAEMQDEEESVRAPKHAASRPAPTMGALRIKKQALPPPSTPSSSLPSTQGLSPPTSTTKRKQPPQMGALKVVTKKAKLISQDERRISEPAEAKLVVKSLAHLGFKGTALDTLVASTYLTVRVGNFSIKTLKAILISKMTRHGMPISGDTISSVVEQLHEWATETADYRLSE